jgi:hypothetical protein
MQVSQTIPKDPAYPPSMDWALLRREGIKHIERLGSQIWTDFNEHDPGITMLEVICYALTDLGYRANLPAADLFANYMKEKPFYSAAEILTSRPVTAIDVRKILVDIPGVHNAWVEQTEDAEVRFWLGNAFSSEALSEALTPFADMYNLPPERIKLFSSIETDNRLIAAMYGCKTNKEKKDAVDLFIKDLVQKVNNYIDNQLTAEERDNLHKTLLSYMAEHYMQESTSFLEENVMGDISLTALTAAEKKFVYHSFLKLQKEQEYFQWGPAVPADPNTTLTKVVYKHEGLRHFFYFEPILCLLLTGSLRFEPVPESTDGEEYYNLFIPKGIYKVSLDLERDANVEANDIVAEALRRLHHIRNLGEDFDHDIRIIEKVKMGIELNLQIDPTKDKLDVFANVYARIQEYLTPQVRFYSLEEMMNRYCVFTFDVSAFEALEDAMLPAPVIAAMRTFGGKEFTGENEFKKAIAASLDKDSFEEYYDQLFVHARKKYDADRVYRGPLLNHGFIDEAEFAKTQPRQTVYKSDLYQLITAVEGVSRVDRIRMFTCKEKNRLMDDWCLAFDCRCLPELDFDCSEFYVNSGTMEIAVLPEDVMNYFEMHSRASTKLNREGSLDLPFPVGISRPDLTSFTSVQEDFPRTYKIGRTGIASRETALRKAQTKQLKGYLLFFDQLLSNYLAQLANVQQLLSVKNASLQAHQPLYDISGVRDLLSHFAPGEDWDHFISDVNNAYVTDLAVMTEGNTTQKKIRQNRILDHLLSRFGESFTDYAMALYRIERPVEAGDIWEDEHGLEESLADKQRFLDHLPDLSANRGSGFNFYADDTNAAIFWDTDNVAGLRKRICAKAGIDSWNTRTITCRPDFIVRVAPVRNLEGAPVYDRHEYYVKKDDQSAARLLVSTEKFSTPSAAETKSLEFLNASVDINNYGIVNGNIIGFWHNIPEDEREIGNAMMLETKPNSDHIQQRLAYLRKLASGNCQDDNFHLLEHLLLRPRSDRYVNLLRPMVCCVDKPALVDPYSFWITVIIPDWAGRFANPVQLNNFKQTVRMETPAHVAIRFCLLSRDQMYSFEKLYYEWLKQLCSAEREELPETTDELVAFMNSLADSIIHYQ